MTNRIFAFMVVVTVLGWYAASATAIHVVEMEICTDPHTQMNPDVFGDYIVWQDNRNGNWDIYAYDYYNQAEYAICTADGNQTNPSIDGGNVLDESTIIIAWQDDRNGNNDIYGYKIPLIYYDLAIGTEIEICIDPCDQQNPVSAGSYVCWQDNRNGNWDIYAKLYGEEEPNEIEICCLPGDQIKPDAIYDPLMWTPPPFYGRIIWQDSRNGDWNIYGYNLEDQNDFLVCVEDGNQTNPSCGLYGFAWQDDRNANNDVYASVCYYDCSESIEFPVCTDPCSQIYPRFSYNGVIWQDNRNGSWDIYGNKIQDYYTGIEFIVSAGDEDRLNPAIHETNILAAWQDRRNGNDDIYAAYLCLWGSDICRSYCAIEVFDDQPYFGSTVGTTDTHVYTPTGDEPLTSSCGFNDFVDAWHPYQPDIGGPVTITTEGSSLDTILSVFNSCFGSYSPYDPEPQLPIELACNDDYCLENTDSKVTLDVVKGKTYYIRISGFNDQKGDYRIVIKRGAATDPIKSDLNGNGKVDWFDFAIFASEWLMSNIE